MKITISSIAIAPLLLSCTLTTTPLSFIPISAAHLRASRHISMAGKASLKRAEDFVSFLNASPTRACLPYAAAAPPPIR